MGSSPEPAGPAYRRLRMFRKRPQVLGAALRAPSAARLAFIMVPTMGRTVPRFHRPGEEIFGA